MYSGCWPMGERRPCPGRVWTANPRVGRVFWRQIRALKRTRAESDRGTFCPRCGGRRVTFMAVEVANPTMSHPCYTVLCATPVALSPCRTSKSPSPPPEDCVGPGPRSPGCASLFHRPNAVDFVDPAYSLISPSYSKASSRRCHKTWAKQKYSSVRRARLPVCPSAHGDWLPLLTRDCSIMY